MRLISRVLIAAIAAASPAGAQTNRVAAMDSLLEKLVGRWEMSGTVRGQAVRYTLDAQRVLGGSFVELHMTDVAQPAGYEARVFIGVDSAGQRYIAHWLDRFGAAYSIPHGTGDARGDTIRLAFAYADGPFRDVFVHDPARDRWQFRLESGTSGGQWSLFAEYQVTRRR